MSPLRRVRVLCSTIISDERGVTTVATDAVGDHVLLTVEEYARLTAEVERMRPVVDAARELIKNSGAESLDELRLSQAIRALDGEP